MRFADCLVRVSSSTKSGTTRSASPSAPASAGWSCSRRSRVNKTTAQLISVIPSHRRRGKLAQRGPRGSGTMHRAATAASWPERSSSSTEANAPLPATMSRHAATASSPTLRSPSAGRTLGARPVPQGRGRGDQQGSLPRCGCHRGSPCPSALGRRTNRGCRRAAGRQHRWHRRTSAAPARGPRRCRRRWPARVAAVVSRCTGPTSRARCDRRSPDRPADRRRGTGPSTGRPSPRGAAL